MPLPASRLGRRAKSQRMELNQTLLLGAMSILASSLCPPARIQKPRLWSGKCRNNPHVFSRDPNQSSKTKWRLHWTPLRGATPLLACRLRRPARWQRMESNMTLLLGVMPMLACSLCREEMPHLASRLGRPARLQQMERSPTLLPGAMLTVVQQLEWPRLRARRSNQLLLKMSLQELEWPRLPTRRSNQLLLKMSVQQLEWRRLRTRRSNQLLLQMTAQQLEWPRRLHRTPLPGAMSLLANRLA